LRGLTIELLHPGEVAVVTSADSIPPSLFLAFLKPSDLVAQFDRTRSVRLHGRPVAAIRSATASAPLSAASLPL
jgi:hypothetical protein